jgi:hypothetical protein
MTGISWSSERLLAFQIRYQVRKREICGGESSLVRVIRFPPTAGQSLIILLLDIMQAALLGSRSV